MNLNLETADRDVYNTLDWIQDLGGMMKGIRMIFSLLVYLLTYSKYETYMLSYLFESFDQNQKSNKTTGNKTDVKEMQQEDAKEAVKSKSQ